MEGPLASGMTRMGDMPPWFWAKSVEVVSAKPARVQSAELPGTPAINSMTGSDGSGVWNQTGGSHT